MPQSAGRVTQGAGRRDRYVTIEEAAASSGTTGYPVETWTVLARAWMSREDLVANERFTGTQDSAFQDTRWQMDYLASMDPELVDVAKLRRLNYSGRIFNIRSASVIGLKRAIELITLAKVG
jgi:head-tail adaptor